MKKSTFNKKSPKSSQAESLNVINPHAAGIDLGSREHWVCVPSSSTASTNKRDNLIQNSSTHIQRMQKALTQMNLQLHKVITDITGVTGLNIIRAIISGEREPRKLAQLADHRIKSSREVIRKALTGNYRFFILCGKPNNLTKILVLIIMNNNIAHGWLITCQKRLNHLVLNLLRLTQLQASYSRVISFELIILD